MRKLRILAVDDEPALLGTISLFFRVHLGHDVNCKPSAEEALDLLKIVSPFDLILTDYDMGVGMNGADFIVEAKRLAPDTTIFWLWSGNRFTEGARLLIGATGVKRIIEKPANVSDLTRFLNEDFTSTHVSVEA